MYSPSEDNGDPFKRGNGGSDYSQPRKSARGPGSPAVPVQEQAEQLTNLRVVESVVIPPSAIEETAAPQSAYVRVMSPDDEPVYANTFSRVFIIALSALLIAAGMGIAILGRLELDDKTILPICPSCNQFVTAMYIVGGCVAGFGLLGIIAAITRVKLVAFLYALILFVIAVLMFCCGVAIITFEVGLKESEVRKLWTTALTDDSDLICDLQNRLHCSGFNSCCQLYDANVTHNVTVFRETYSATNSMCNVTTAEDFLNECDVSPPCWTSNQDYSEPCNAKVTDLVKSHFKPLIGVSAGCTVLFAAATVFAVRMVLKSAPARRSLSP
jgi:hypothetical protein